MTDQLDNIITIDSQYLVRLEAEIEKLNRRARKISVPEVSFNIVGTTLQCWDEERWVDADQFADSHLVPNRTLHEVEIVGEGPKLEGWTFIGRLDHASIEGGVIVNTVPGESIPEQFWDAAPDCQHCDQQRYRKDTFIFRSDDDEFKQVGRSCLKDFFGHDPMKIARWIEFLSRHIAELKDEDYFSEKSGKSLPKEYDIVGVLETTVAVVRTIGWLSKSAASEDETPTSYHVSYLLNPPSPARKDYRFWREFKDSVQFDKEADHAEALAAIEWIKEQQSNNEYIHNLQAISGSATITWRHFGLWCSLISAYQRSQETLILQKRQQKLNEYFGTEGERVEVEVTCTGHSSYETDFGYTKIHKFLTEAGHSLVWHYTGGCTKVEQGTKVVIRARIKRHKEYKEWKQTTLSRVFVVEVLNTI